MATRMKPLARLMWAVTRDGEIFFAYPDRRRARTLASNYRSAGSRHRWSVCRVRVTPIKKERRE